MQGNDLDTLTFLFDLFFRDSILNRGMPFKLYCMIIMLDQHAEMMQGEPKQQEEIFLRQQAWTRLKARPLIFQCGACLTIGLASAIPR